MILKMMKPFKWMLCLAALVAAASCNKYLDVQPKGFTLLATTTDYDQWLNTTELASYLPRELNLLADNVDMVNIPDPPVGTDQLVYLWREQFDPVVDASPVIWQNMYASIYYFNTVLAGIDSASGSQREKDRLKGEALTGRAMDYLYLVNIYGKPYDAATAATDLAAPFVTSNDIAADVPKPSTVQALYDQIIADLNKAIPIVGNDNSKNRYRATLGSTYSVLARTYLYMRNYEQAAHYAQLALENGPSEVQDFTKMADDGGLGVLIFRPDALYARLSKSLGDTEYPTLEFMRTYDKNDLRLKFYFRDEDNYNFTERGKVTYSPSGASSGSAFPNWGTSVAEMRLIIAEHAAREGDLATALGEIHHIRSRRIPADKYVRFESDDQETVLQKVLLEKQQEFPFNGTRWFEMRRLNKEGRMPTVNRYNGSGNVIATLAPGSPRYTLEIPIQVLYFNPHW